MPRRNKPKHRNSRPKGKARPRSYHHRDTSPEVKRWKDDERRKAA